MSKHVPGQQIGYLAFLKQEAIIFLSFSVCTELMSWSHLAHCCSYFTGHPSWVILEMFHLSHHPWFSLDHDGLATAVIRLSEKWVYVCACVYVWEKDSGKNENRSFMAKSWEEQICPSASFPACMSLWLPTKEVRANTQLSQSSIISHSQIYTFHYCLPHFPLWVRWALVVNNIFEVYCTGTYGQIPD